MRKTFYEQGQIAIFSLSLTSYRVSTDVSQPQHCSKELLETAEVNECAHVPVKSYLPQRLEPDLSCEQQFADPGFR